MGDRRRFDLFATAISAQFYDRSLTIADVASGKGYLRHALMEHGYANITSWDKRPANSKGRPGRRYGHFIWDKAPSYDLVLGMHPDGATDQIIRYAIEYRVPFVVCPCCIIPSAIMYWGHHSFGPWVDHLTKIAVEGRFRVIQSQLKMSGRNLVLTGLPLP